MMHARTPRAGLVLWTVSTFTLTACAPEPRREGETEDETAGTSASAGTTAGTSTATSATSDASTTATSATGSSDTGSTSTTTDSTSDGTADGGSDGIRFDIGTALDIPGAGCPMEGGQDCGCTAVDVLFVVDNSGSMQQHAPAVNAAFATFVEEMVGVLPPETSLHVGVTRATGFYDPGNSGGFNGTDCEASVTDGVFNPPDTGTDNGINGQQGRLYDHAGLRYFEIDTGTDPQPLKDWFGGALMGSIDGFVQHSNTETVIAGAAYPFHPANATTNAGFMRQNAVLVIFLLSDSPDLSPKAVPTSDFVDIVSTAKSGCGDMCIITTGAIAGGCYDGMGITNTRLYDFMNGFGHPPASFVEFGWSGSPDFTGVLGTALAEVIGTTCEQIPPVG